LVEVSTIIKQYTKDFRDPKAFWNRTSLEFSSSCELIIPNFSAQNLINWKFESEFGKTELTEVFGRCLTFFKLKVADSREEKWNSISINPGAQMEARGTQYFLLTMTVKSFQNRSRRHQVD
jgi:sucrose-6-phosphate hydrolase SacC (GH32 family)